MQKKRGLRMEGDTGERRLEQPWLLYFEGLKNQTFCCISDPTKTYSTSIPELWASRLCTVQHGWYLLENVISGHVSQLFLWNPYTLKKIKLPPLKHNGNIIGNCVLSSSPTANNQVCSIFLFSLHTPSIFYCQLGDEQWIKEGFDKDIARLLAVIGKVPLKEGKTFFANPVYCNGCLYAGMWTSYAYTLVVIEKLQPNGLKINPTFVLMPTLPQAYFQQHLSRLLGSNNVLFRIQILHAQDRVTAVAVYRFDCSRMVWEKVKSIKDRVFFISSHDSPFACQAINPETEGGRVYIALEDNNFVYIYNIEDDSLVISQPFSSLPKKRSYSRWFMPDIGMTDTLEEEIGKAPQIREKKSICGAIHLKETRDKALNESALPLDVVEVIAKHLIDVLDYLHFRATNRLFRLAAPPVQWRLSSSMSMSRSIDYGLLCHNHCYQGFWNRSLGVVQFDTTKNRYLAAGDDFSIKFWDVDNVQLLTTVDADGGLPASPRIRFNRDGSLLAISAIENGIKILANGDGIRLLRSLENSLYDALRTSEAMTKPTTNPISVPAAATSAALAERPHPW